MNLEGLEIVSKAINGTGSIRHVERIRADIKEGVSVGCFTVASTEKIGSLQRDASPISEALHREGLLYVEGRDIDPTTMNVPLIKYLGSNGGFHFYQDLLA